MNKDRLIATIVACVVVIGVVIAVLVSPTETAEPEYTGFVDVSDASVVPYLEFRLAIGETLQAELVVYEGNVVFVVSDYWNRRIHDVVVKPGETYPFSIEAKQTGERYRCYFLYLHGEKDLPRDAVFYSNMTPSGWR